MLILENADKLLFHIDEAMSWESVRNLARMKTTFILIRNIALQALADQTAWKICQFLQ